MAESVIFLLIVGFAIIGIMVAFDITWIDPRFILIVLALFILPGMYAAVTSAPFVPSSRKRHKAMLRLAGLGSDDVVYDLGCGDGRLIFHSAPHVKKAVGYELSVPLYFFGKLRQWLTFSKGKIRFGNIWKQNYKDANVIFCYLFPKSMKRFYKEIWPTLKPGTRIISNAFQIHDVKPLKQEGKVYLYQK